MAGRRARLARTRPSTPDGNARGEDALYRDVRRHGRLSLPVPLPLALDSPAAFARRTAFVDSEVAGAIGRGVAQIVLVGAGYDGRALRFAGGTRWFEVDDPAAQDDKRRRLASLGVSAPDVAYVGCDLVRPEASTGTASGGIAGLGAALAEAGHRADAPSLFVCEGLFPHLTLEAAASLCGALRGRAAAGSVLAATFLVLPGAGRGLGASAAAAVRTAADLLLQAGGSPLRNRLQAGDAEKLMVVTGWRVARTEDTGRGRLHPGARLLALSATPAPEAAAA